VNPVTRTPCTAATPSTIAVILEKTIKSQIGDTTSGNSRKISF
jgi:hypothetical protein